MPSKLRNDRQWSFVQLAKWKESVTTSGGELHYFLSSIKAPPWRSDEATLAKRSLCWSVKNTSQEMTGLFLISSGMLLKEKATALSSRWSKIVAGWSLWTQWVHDLFGLCSIHFPNKTQLLFGKDNMVLFWLPPHIKNFVYKRANFPKKELTAMVVYIDNLQRW